MSGGKTYVLVHGAWHGGWCWRRVEERLREAGHRVFAPTCSGLGERAHLLSRSIDLETFTRDVVGLIECEELADIVLVGHSFGGSPISGAADRVKQRIRHLVYLDSLILEGGQRVVDRMPPDLLSARLKAAEEATGGIGIPAPPPEAFAVSAPDDVAWLRRRLTPHPAGTYFSPLALGGPVGNGLPCTYVACVEPVYGPLESSREWVRRQPGWNWREIATGHDAMVTAPEALARLLEEIG
jgi:pimeloyl-ACP methyl ester carboxylesterase